MSDRIPPTREVLLESLSLSEEILKDLELSRTPLVTAALKASRLARLLNNSDAQKMFQYEASGYPSEPDGVPAEPWRLMRIANRISIEKDETTGGMVERGFTTAIESLEHDIESTKIRLQASQDPDISLSSSHPQQFVHAPAGNAKERQLMMTRIGNTSSRLASRRALIYEYVVRNHFELKFTGVAESVFSAVRSSVDRHVGELVPDAVQKFTSIHDNLRSTNPEDWSNAVHSCRRILQDLADALFPARGEPRIKGAKTIQLGAENYINRLVCFAEDNAVSERFSDLVGSHLGFLGDRLDAVFRATQKGSHSSVSKADANRFVLYTYMIVGDLLSIRPTAQ